MLVSTSIFWRIMGIFSSYLDSAAADEVAILADTAAMIAACWAIIKLGARFLRNVRLPEWHSAVKNDGVRFFNIYEWSIE
jgi:hypothetical protein